MKKLRLTLGLFLTTVSVTFAQKSNHKLSYISLRSSIDSEMKLNNFLADHSLNTIDEFHYGGGLGVEYQPSTYGVNVEANVDFTTGETELKNTQTKIAFLVNIFEKDEWKVNLAPFFAYTFSELKLTYAEGNELDMHSDSYLEGGVMLLNMNYGNIGLGVNNSFNIKSTHVDLRLGYEFALADSEWKSDNLELLNFEKENRSRIYLNLAIPFEFN